MCSAAAAPTSLLNATTPPNAETGSHATAFSYAASTVSATATPQGVVCLITAQAACAEPDQADAVMHAASISRMLLKDSSFPCSCCRSASEPRGASASA